MIGVIGDIHGCYYTLEELYRTVRDAYGEIQLYSAGDLIDRGNHSVDVIEFCKSENILPVLGNHEILFYYSFEFPNHPYREVWAANGNFKTLKSYAGRNDLLEDHIDYCKNLPLFFNTPDAFISHAGISILMQDKMSGWADWSHVQWNDFLTIHLTDSIGVAWNRTALMDIGKLQVIGHTKRRFASFDARANSVYADTGAYTGNLLSCVIVHEHTLIETIVVPTDPKDILFSEI